MNLNFSSFQYGIHHRKISGGLVGAIVILVATAFLTGSGRISGGDLGLSLLHVSKFGDGIVYSWTADAGMGQPGIRNVAWVPLYSILSVINTFLPGKAVVFLFFLAVLELAFIFFYLASLKISNDVSTSLITSIFFIFSPGIISTYLTVFIQSAVIIVFISSFLLYVAVSLENPNWNRLILLTVLVSPLLLSIANLGYLLPVYIVFISIASISGNWKEVGFFVTLVGLLGTFLYLPLIVSTIQSPEMHGLSRTSTSILQYAIVESEAVNIYQEFFPVKKGEPYFLSCLLMNLIFLIISFLPWITGQAKGKYRYYYAGIFNFLVGIVAAKGVIPPFETANAIFYSHIPFAFAFRSPFAKFSIIALVGQAIMVLFGLQELKRVARVPEIGTVGKYIVPLIIIVGIAAPGTLYMKSDIIGQGIQHEENGLEDHYSPVVEALDDRNGGRVLIAPIRKSTFVNYTIDGYNYYGAANEYVFFDRPVISNYRDNRMIFQIVEDADGNFTKKRVERFLIYANIRYVIIDKARENSSFISYQSMENTLRDIDNCSLNSIHQEISIYKCDIAKGYFHTGPGERRFEYEMIQPTKWKMSVENISNTTVFFSQAYSPHWRGVLLDQEGDKVGSVEPKQSQGGTMKFRFNNSRAHDLIIWYQIEKVVRTGKIISGMTIVMILVWLLVNGLYAGGLTRDVRKK